MPAAPGDLVDPDLKEVVQAVLVELLVGDAADDPPDRLPVDPGQPGDRGLVSPSRQPRDEILQIARQPGAVTRERDALDMHAMARTAQLAQRRADLQAPDAQIEVAPDRLVGLGALPRTRAERAARTDQPAAAQRDADQHAIGLKQHRRDAHSVQAQQATECGGDAHGKRPPARRI